MYLNCKTFFSYRYGTFSTADLVNEGTEQGAAALCLTNINNASDWWDFYTFCTDAGIKPLLGAEIRNGDEFLFLVIARNNSGLKWINQYLSFHLQTKRAFTVDHVWTDDLIIIFPFGKKTPAELEPNEFIGVRPSQVNRLYTSDLSLPEKFLVLQPVTYKDKFTFNLHRLLRAVDKNIILSKQNGVEVAATDEYFLPPGEILSAFRQYPFIITNTLKLVESCA